MRPFTDYLGIMGEGLQCYLDRNDPPSGLSIDASYIENWNLISAMGCVSSYLEYLIK